MKVIKFEQRTKKISVHFESNHYGSFEALAGGVYPTQSNLDGKTYELYLYNVRTLDAIAEYLRTA